MILSRIKIYVIRGHSMKKKSFKIIPILNSKLKETFFYEEKKKIRKKKFTTTLKTNLKKKITKE